MDKVQKAGAFVLEIKGLHTKETKHMRSSKTNPWLAITVFLFSNIAVAAPFSVADVSTISPCPSFCGGSGGESDFDNDGGEGLTSALSSLSNIDGDGRAQTVFVGASLLPELSAEAFSNAQALTVRSSRVSSQATGMQQYFYSGGPSAVTMSAMFDGTISGEARITGSLVVARAINGADVPLSTDFGTLVFEILALDDDLESLGEDRSTLSLPGPGADQLDVTFSVNNGDSIFIWASLFATGERGGSADAFNTMTLAFDDPTGFDPQLGQTPNPVPVPAAVWLFATALIGFIGISRRRKVD